MEATIEKPKVEDGRDNVGRFAGKAGPGRPSRRIKEIKDRYTGHARADVLKLLGADVERVEGELAEENAKLAEFENDYLKRCEPVLKVVAELEIALVRCRVAREYLRNPGAFSGVDPLPREAALDEYYKALARLEAAREAFAELSEPTFTRSEALADVGRWDALARWERARDELQDAERDEIEARNKATALGNPLTMPDAVMLSKRVQEDRPGDYPHSPFRKRAV